MTVVKNRLVYPDGTAHAGQRIVATLMSGPNWLGEDDARALGWVETYTDSSGLWQLNLMPYTQVDPPGDEDMYYRVDEGEQQWNIRVPPFNDGGSLWLKDLVIDPPPARRQTWRLGGLEDVSNQRPEDGEVLLYRDGQWVPATLPTPTTELAALSDVDGESLPQAGIGDPLVYLGSGMWGVLTGDDPTTGTLTFYADYDPDDAEGRTVLVELQSRTEGMDVTIDWDDGSDTTVLDADTTTASHRYRRDGTYELYVAYSDDSEVGQPVLGSQDVLVIPNPNLEGTTMSTDTETDPHPFSPVLVFRQMSALRASCRISSYTGRYILYWGDGEQTLITGSDTKIKAKPYPGAGPYTVVAVEYGNTSNVLARRTMFIREGGMHATVAEPPDQDNTVTVTWDEDASATAAPHVTVFWDFDNEDGPVEQHWAIPGQSLTHTYDAPGDYRVRLWDPDTSMQQTFPVTVSGQTHDPDGTFTQHDPKDEWTVRFTLTAATLADTPIVVEWGLWDDNSNPVQTVMESPKVGDTVTYTYPEPAPGDGMYMPIAYFQGWPEGHDPVVGEVTVPFS